MAIVGRVENRPMSTTSPATYRAVVCRCLLCGRKQIYARDYGNALVGGTNVLPFCDCYDAGFTQPIRIIPND
jgi:hypothetical protein